MKNNVKENEHPTLILSREYETKTCTIIVNGFYNNDGNEILSDKLLRLMKHDVEKNQEDE